MSFLSDMLQALDHWDEWKRMRQGPARIDALEARIAKLESALAAQPGDPRPLCGACGKGRMAVTEEKPDRIFGDLGVSQVTRACTACGHTTTGQVQN